MQNLTSKQPKEKTYKYLNFHETQDYVDAAKTVKMSE
jgi:hypothetical protein